MLSEEFALALTSSREEDVQQFLAEHHEVLLKTFCPTGTYLCIPKFRFGAEYVSDFVIVQLWSLVTKIILIELEPPTSEVYTIQGKYASRLNGAIQQINDWFAWIRENNSYFCNSIVHRTRTMNEGLANALLIVS